MHPNHVDLYAGLFGLALVPNRFDLGRGVVITRTYAHFMAPFMMAFAPPAPGKPHPAPWIPAKGSIALDIAAELFLPATTCIEQLDRMNTVWWIAALMRLHASSVISVPVVSSERFSSIPAIQQEPHLWPIEIHTPRLFPQGADVCTLDVNELEWLRDNWYEASALLANKDFSFAFRAIDSSVWNHSPDLALVAVWGALERLFSSSSTELAFRVSANIAAYLEPPGRGRYTCFKKVKGLYDSRSKAAHGSGEASMSDYADTYTIARRVLVAMIQARHVPEKREIEAKLFSDPIGISSAQASEQ